MLFNLELKGNLYNVTPILGPPLYINGFSLAKQVFQCKEMTITCIKRNARNIFRSVIRTIFIENVKYDIIGIAC